MLWPSICRFDQDPSRSLATREFALPRLCRCTWFFSRASPKHQTHHILCVPSLPVFVGRTILYTHTRCTSHFVYLSIFFTYSILGKIELTAKMNKFWSSLNSWGFYGAPRQFLQNCMENWIHCKNGRILELFKSMGFLWCAERIFAKSHEKILIQKCNSLSIYENLSRILYLRFSGCIFYGVSCLCVEKYA